VEHVADGARTYAVYREVQRGSPEVVSFIVFYTATKGAFDIKPYVDNESPAHFAARHVEEKKAIMGVDGVAWAFDGLVERPPRESEINPDIEHNWFEARVPALGGKLATCTPTFKYAGPAQGSSNAAYAMALTCTAKDHTGTYYEDSVTSTLWHVEWGPKKGR
jgi:hypothetical protein